MPLDRLGKPDARQSGDEASRRSSSRPIRVLVVDQGATARRRVCLAGRRAAGQSQWFEAADADAASRTLAFSAIDLVLADFHTIRHNLHRLTQGAAADPCEPAPLVVVISEDNEPQGIQQMLDAGAECCLPKHLPQRILESELCRIVAQTRRKAGLS